jgi:FtsP/CotA-like multicopper oxidase with cupredoxin domain
LRQFARDSIALPQTFTEDYLFLSPGYRIEFLLGGEGVLRDGETWCLVASRFLQDNSGRPPTSPIVPLNRGDIDEMLLDGDLVAVLNVAADYGAPTSVVQPTEEELASVAPSTVIDGVAAVDRCAAAAAVETPADID